MKVLVTGGMGYIGSHTWIASLPASSSQQQLQRSSGHSLRQMTDDSWRWQTNYPQGLDLNSESADE